MESKKMMKKELAFMKKKGAPKSMLKHEKAEAKGMKKGGMSGCYAEGGMVKKYAGGGMAPPAGPDKEPMNSGTAPGRMPYIPPTPQQLARYRREYQRTNSSPQQETRGMQGQRGYAKGGAVKKCADGGAVKSAPKPYVPTTADRNEISGGDQEMENRSQTRGAGRGPMSRNGMKPKKYAAGGMVRADGCATKGKTKGRFI